MRLTVPKLVQPSTLLHYCECYPFDEFLVDICLSLFIIKPTINSFSNRQAKQFEFRIPQSIQHLWKNSCILLETRCRRVACRKCSQSIHNLCTQGFRVTIIILDIPSLNSQPIADYAKRKRRCSVPFERPSLKWFSSRCCPL